jgi:signal recognition particle GTPase
LDAGKAILAICHGMQIMNVAQGGTLYQNIPSQVSGAMEHRGGRSSISARHSVTVEPGSRLAEIMKGIPRLEICSTHHQAVKDLGKNLSNLIRKIVSGTTVDKKSVEDIIKDLKVILLESDVDTKLTEQITNGIRKKCLEEKSRPA